MARIFLIVAAAVGTFSLFPTDKANADFYYGFQRTYEVQVEYWFFDTDYSYWRTVFSSDDRDEAELVYEALLIAKENYQLNAIVPNEYWRYVAVDVRMVVKWEPIKIDSEPKLQRYDGNLRSTTDLRVSGN